MAFAPVLTKGLAVIKVEADERTIERLRQLRLVEERDGGLYLRRIRDYGRKIDRLLEEEGLTLTVEVRGG
ncbi:hypothetical protein, partial [Geoglobus ahangari]